MKNFTLVIMAAGLGSRFGGLKQLTPVGPNNEFIIDYSIYDALQEGFNKIVFVIKEEHLEDFKQTIGNRISKYIQVEYVIQKINVLPNGYTIPTQRSKPLGTGHAIYCCKDVVKEPFAVITADDFYGRKVFSQAMNFLKMHTESVTDYGMIASPIIQTLDKNSPVKRGICKVKDDKLVEIVECSVEYQSDSVIATPLNNTAKTPMIIPQDTPSSLSFFLFYPTIFDYVEEEFVNFLTSKNNNLLEDEFFLPDVIDNVIKNNKGNVYVYNSDSTWHGMTYKKDQELVHNAIMDLIKEHVYPSKLWN